MVASTLKDYFSLLKPSVMSLAIFTAFCGFLLAPGKIHFVEAVISLCCVAVGAGGAGVLNMWYEWDLDAQMSRTKKRPIPRQAIDPKEALALGLTLSGFSVVLLGLASNYFAAFLLAFTIFFYGVVYTMCLKPRTPQNIVIGGIAGAFPPVIGWLIVSSEFSWTPTLMFFLIFFWTPVHFWALALYQVDEYSKVNIPMLPTLVGKKKTAEHMFIYAIATVFVSLLLFFMELFSFFYFLGALVLGGYLLIKTWRVWKKDLQESSKLFVYTILYLFLLFLLMLVDHWLFY
ncbi:MAG: protoheme IX farnesyltransferase [Alphaproteobacteria bacterium]|nr:protoheme IX farnesyltransferase [Alphaproteobacteria bacterium]